MPKGRPTKASDGLQQHTTQWGWIRLPLLASWVLEHREQCLKLRCQRWTLPWPSPLIWIWLWPLLCLQLMISSDLQL